MKKSRKKQDNDQEKADESTFIIPAESSDPIGTIFDRFTAHYTPFGFQSRDETIDYYPLPYKPEPEDELLLKQPWRLLLELYSDDQRRMMGLDLYGDVILGRGDSRPGRIILNFGPYGAKDLGVSREHAMLRPTATKLFAIDQGSTNGMTVNGAPSGRGIATVIRDQDLLALGKMILMIHIVSKPGK
jgi:hypothetical protein